MVIFKRCALPALVAFHLALMPLGFNDGAWAQTADRSTPAEAERRVAPAAEDTWGERLFEGAWYDEITVAGNEVWRIGLLFATLLAALLLGKLAGLILERLAVSFEARQRGLAAVACRALGGSASFALLTIGLALGLEFLRLNPTVERIAGTITSVLMAMAVGYIAWRMVDVVDHALRQMSARTPSKLDDMLAPLVRRSLRATVVILALVQVLTILSDKPVTSIIAGLGVGGIAIGLAAQDTIKNFFGSVMIFSDRPFELGDRIIVDGHDGSVENVGFRSTRLRTGEGDLITIPNGELANKSILNAGKRPSLRRGFSVAVTYDTPPDKLAQAVQIIKDILQNHEGMDPGMPPRVFFSDLKDWSLNLSVTYWYHPPDFWNFSAFNERVNFEILRRFRAAEIEFAYPTQQVFLAEDPKRPPRSDHR